MVGVMTVSRYTYRASPLYGWVELVCGACDCEWTVRGYVEDVGQCPACGEPFYLGWLRQHNTDHRWGNSTPQFT